MQSNLLSLLLASFLVPVHFGAAALAAVNDGYGIPRKPSSPAGLSMVPDETPVSFPTSSSVRVSTKAKETKLLAASVIVNQRIHIMEAKLFAQIKAKLKKGYKLIDIQERHDTNDALKEKSFQITAIFESPATPANGL